MPTLSVSRSNDVQLLVDSFLERIGDDHSKIVVQLYEKTFDHHHETLSFQERIDVFKLTQDAHELLKKLNKSEVSDDEKAKLVRVASQLVEVKTSISVEAEILIDYITECLDKLQGNNKSISQIRQSLKGRLSCHSLDKLSCAAKLNRNTINKYRDRVQRISSQVKNCKYIIGHMSSIIEYCSA